MERAGPGMALLIPATDAKQAKSIAAFLRRKFKDGEFQTVRRRTGQVHSVYIFHRQTNGNRRKESADD